MAAVKDFLLGRSLASDEQGGQKIGWFEAVPAMGLDGLGSASYGPEAALTILMALGAASLNWFGFVMAPVVLLLAVLYLSYRQTVVAYPSNGGAYTVSKENLGRNPSLLAAAAIMIDYVLNVAVGISAGVGALTSAAPSLASLTIPLCLAVLLVVTLANLRGTLEAGWLFALPTYVFIVSFLGLIGVGLWTVMTSGGHPQPIIAPPGLHAASGKAVGAWLLIRAFAAGCTAMTGVEAVSNGVGSFKKPVIKQAQATLTIICLVLGLLLMGITVVARGYQIRAMDQTQPGYQSVLSQLAGAVAGHTPVYYTAMASLLAVLCFSANTSFVGFPRLCKLVAEDGYLPKPFAVADRRLVFSASVGFLAVAAAALLVVFGGVTDRLIPLFAIGAFLTFAMSQIGMVVHWRKQPGGGGVRLWINAVGAGVTLLALGVIVVAKFLDGAWLVILITPATVALLRTIGGYYDHLEGALAATGPFQPEGTTSPTVVVAVEERSRMTDDALRFAMSLSSDVVAVHLMKLEGPDQEEDIERLKREWGIDVEQPCRMTMDRPPKLVLLPSPYRTIAEPLLDYLKTLEAETPGRAVAVLIPQLVLTQWWQRLLHDRRADRLRRHLLAKGGPKLNVIIAPWRPDRSAYRP